jgi:O-antigen/teichoic acid export membrane protein
MAERIGSYFDGHRVSKDLGRIALRGGIVSVAIQFGNGALQIAAAIVLARLLTPEDFGLVAIVTVLTSYAPILIDFGLGEATPQRREITEGQVSGLFWLTTAIGFAVALVVVACSPLVASLYREPRLEPISLSIAVTFVLAGASNQHLALLRRTMQFSRLGKIQLLGTLAGIAAAVGCALCGLGYWALVLRPIASSLCVAAGAWLGCRWRPGFPVFDSELKSMIRFGMHVVCFSVTYTISKTVDRIVLALVYPPDQVGYYQNASTLYENSIRSALTQVHLVGSTALSKFQSNPAILRKKYEAALSVLAFFVMPSAAILSVTAEDLTVVLLGDRWRAAGSLLSIIALRGIFHVLEASQGWLHLSIGRADRWKNWGIISLIVQVVAALCGLPFGAQGVAVATVVAGFLLSLPAILYAGRPIGIDAALVLRATLPQMIGAFASAAGGWWLGIAMPTDYPSYARIFWLSGFCVCIYFFVVLIVFRLTEPIKIAQSIVRDYLQDRTRSPLIGPEPDQ